MIRYSLSVVKYSSMCFHICFKADNLWHGHPKRLSLTAYTYTVPVTFTSLQPVQMVYVCVKLNMGLSRLTTTSAAKSTCVNYKTHAGKGYKLCGRRFCLITFPGIQYIHSCTFQNRWGPRVYKGRLTSMKGQQAL